MERGQVGKQEKTVVVSETLERAFIKLNTIANTDRDTNSKTVVLSEKLSWNYTHKYRHSNTHTASKDKIHTYIIYIRCACRKN